MMTLEECRHFYSQEVRFAANLATPGLVEAFANVPREEFLGPPPWHIGSAESRALSAAGMAALSYVAVDDPRDVYHNVVVSVDREKDINNGQPSALARWIDALALQPGARAYHLGCGVGYYTAIMAEVVGPRGCVVGLDLESDLAARARKNLATYSQVKISAGDGSVFDPDDCDAMLVNCGVTHPQTRWLDRLRDGGRLVVPLTIPMNPKIGQGVMMKIIRSGNSYATEVLMPLAIYSGGTLRDASLELQLRKGFATGSFLKLKSVRRDAHECGDECVVHTRDVCLSLFEPRHAAAH